jgi:hypothetical protein
MRFVLIDILLFLLPFAAYAVWLKLGGNDPVTALKMQRSPWLWLLVAGLLLAIGGFFVLAEFGGAPPGEVYVPPHEENGRIVPGHFLGEPTR